MSKKVLSSEERNRRVLLKFYKDRTKELKKEVSALKRKLTKKQKELYKEEEKRYLKLMNDFIDRMYIENDRNLENFKTGDFTVLSHMKSFTRFKLLKEPKPKRAPAEKQSYGDPYTCGSEYFPPYYRRSW